MTKQIAIVGGGMTGLSAADVLSRAGVSCTVYEQAPVVGGLAGSFEVNGTYLEKFYHHLFTSDLSMVALIERLGLGDRLEWLPTTNSYYANRFYRLSTPLDLLRFTRISLFDRFRLGLLYLRTRFIHDWRPLEAITARSGWWPWPASGSTRPSGSRSSGASLAATPTRSPRCGCGTS